LDEEITNHQRGLIWEDHRSRYFHLTRLRGSMFLLPKGVAVREREVTGGGGLGLFLGRKRKTRGRERIDRSLTVGGGRKEQRVGRSPTSCS